MSCEDTLRLLDPAATIERRNGGAWVDATQIDIRTLAQLMLDGECRFMTMSVVPDGDGNRFLYHWDVDGEIVTVTKRISGNEAVSIADIWPAAEWIERETRDYFAIEFTNRATTAPLVLREGDEPGFFNRTTTVTDDPADDGWGEAFSADAEGTL